MNNPINKVENEKISFNLTQNNFADIILNFLGKKQKLLYTVENSNFKIERNDVEQFYYLLNEKIRKEHYTSVGYFSVNIIYTDSTQCEINGIEALEKFLETRDVIPRSIILSWNIILNFPENPTIENQKIEVSFNVSDDQNNVIQLNIEHTNQAWGVEVLNLFKDHIQTIIIEKPKKLIVAEKINNFLNYRNTLLPLIVLPLILFTLMTFILDDDQIRTPGIKKHASITSISQIIDAGIEDNNKIEMLLAIYLLDKQYHDINYFKNLSSQKLKQQLEKIITNRTTAKNNLKSQIYSIGIFILGLIISLKLYVMQVMKFLKIKSFILTTSKAEKIHNEFYNSKSRIEYYSLSLIAISIICSVVANIIYQFFFNT